MKGKQVNLWSKQPNCAGELCPAHYPFLRAFFLLLVTATNSNFSMIFYHKLRLLNSSLRLI